MKSISKIVKYIIDLLEGRVDYGKKTELHELKNIGKEIAKKLYSIGITDLSELQKLGSKETFFRLKKAYPNVCLVHLYSLEGAIENTNYNELSVKKKQELKGYSDSLKINN